MRLRAKVISPACIILGIDDAVPIEVTGAWWFAKRYHPVCTDLTGNNDARVFERCNRWLDPGTDEIGPDFCPYSGFARSVGSTIHDLVSVSEELRSGTHPNLNADCEWYPNRA